MPEPASGPRVSAPSWLARISDPNIALGWLYAVGGAQGVLIMTLRHWTIAYPGIVLGAAAFAGVAAPLIWLLRRRLDVRSRHVCLAIGTAATSVAVYGCGAQPSSLSAAYLYFLITLYAAAYFRPVEAACHLVAVAGSYALVLSLHATPESLAQWIQAISAFAVVAVIVGGFAFYVRSSAAALTDQAFHDSLTGLPNRALFLDRLDHAIAQADSEQVACGLLFMDLDDFKQVNDSLGHAVGDQLLISAAQRLATVTRASDTVARLGGDEFAVLVRHGPMPSAAEDLAGRIVTAFDAPFTVGAVELYVGVSIGVAVRPPGSEDTTDLLRDADLAMYQAKRQGKGRFETVRLGMQDEAADHLRLLTDLRQAWEQQQFEVYYQLIVATGSIRPVGAEALLRWHHPERGLVPPDEFIGAAESVGLIAPIGAWVLRQACRQAQAWRQGDGGADETFYISVNVSPLQLAEPGIVEDVIRALRESGLPAGRLVLEITESSVMRDFDTGLARLHALKGLGVRLALDDYGTGYSSLSRLGQLPVDIVKVDKSFIDNVADGREGGALTRSILDVTAALGMVSIAEGVETTAQHHAVGQLGCEAAQGYLFARPATAADAGIALRRLTVTGAPAQSIGGQHPASSR